jgi:hypothetical protein
LQFTLRLDKFYYKHVLYPAKQNKTKNHTGILSSLQHQTLKYVPCLPISSVSFKITTPSISSWRRKKNQIEWRIEASLEVEEEGKKKH